MEISAVLEVNVFILCFIGTYPDYVWLLRVIAMESAFRICDLVVEARRGPVGRSLLEAQHRNGLTGTKSWRSTATTKTASYS